MTFILSKVIWTVIQPSNLLILMLLVGLILRRLGRRRFSNLLTTTAAGVLTFVALVPIGGLVLRPLETRFPVPDLPASIDGIVVLGGSVQAELTVEHGQPALNHRAERLTTLVRLARAYPDARLVFTGGSGALLGAPITEAAIAAQVFGELGLDPARLTYEDESRNTYENGVLSQRLVQPKPGETWVLVTSASHLPRSVGVFRALGWPVLPLPVDFNTSARLRPGFWLGGHLNELDWATREWVGLLAYRLLGRTNTLFPAPANVDS